MLTAIVAAIAISVGPAAAFGNCCCVIAGATHQLGTQSLGCCAADPAPGGVDARGCCAAPTGEAAGDMSPAAAAAPAAAIMGACSGPAPSVSCGDSPGAAKLPCPCTGACCETRVTESAAILAQPVQAVTLLDWDALPTALVDAPQWPLSSTALVSHRQPSFLSAQARCAMLCRWLN